MFQSDLLKGKRILITGGGTGLGKSMGRRVLELGAQLVICGRRQNVLEETRAEFDADFPGRSRAISCDLRDAAEVDRLVTARSEEHTSELQSLMRISYAVFCLKKKKTKPNCGRRKTYNNTTTKILHKTEKHN